MSRPTPWWAVPLIAIATVIGVIASSNSGIGLADSARHLISDGPAGSLFAQLAADHADRGLVLINTDITYRDAVGAGTGIVLTADGEVLTNNHVVEGATQVTVTDTGTGHTYDADVIGYDRTHDIAVLQLRGASGLPTAPIGNASQVAVGDAVLAVGNAGGQGLSRARGTVTSLGQTIVAADELAAPEQLHGMIETNANIRAGDSGGPLLNDHGQVIAIDTAASAQYKLQNSRATQGFAIPIDTAVSIADQIRSGNASASMHIGATPMLGIGVGNAPGEGGVQVRQVLRGSPADQAGIAPGDVVTAFGGQTLNSDTMLTDRLDQHHPGDDVSVTWLDPSGQQYSTTVTLATGPVG